MAKEKEKEKEEKKEKKHIAEMSPAEQEKALAIMIKQIEKDENTPGIIRRGDSNLIVPVDTISTGSLGLDIATGIGGLPRGRIVEIFGPESSGKTTLALHVIAKAQKMGGRAAVIDAEQALDLSYAKKLGVDIDQLFFSQPDYGEQALRTGDRLIESGLFSVIAFDSVSALIPKSELEGEIGDSSMGAQARMMSQTMRKLVGITRKTNTLVIFINQIRMKIGVVMGNPETTSGGNALKFFASMRLDIRRSTGKTGQVKGKGGEDEGAEILGNKTYVKIIKNKLGPPFRMAEFDILYSKGIDTVGELVDLGVRYNIFTKSGAWYAYQGENFAQGKANAVEYLKEHPDVAATAKDAITKEAFKDIEIAALIPEVDTPELDTTVNE